MITIIISCLTFIALIASTFLFPKIRLKHTTVSSFWVIAFIGAILLVATQQLSFKEIFAGLASSSKVNPVKILILFFSMTMISVFLDEAGFFEKIASKSVKSAGKSQFKLFLILYCLVSVLTIFTSNDIVILTFTPFICYFAKRTKINPIPYLVAEFAAANTWSMMLIVGNPTNIYLASNAGFNFVSYLKVMALPTLAAGIVEILLLLLIFKKQLSKSIDSIEQDSINVNKVDCILGLSTLVVCVVLLVISSYVKGMEMWIVSLCSAGFLIIYMIMKSLISNDKTNNSKYVLIFKRLPYNLIPFILSMFVIVLGLEKNGITSKIASALGSKGTIFAYGFTSYLTANITNNIPMSILYSSIIPNSSPIFVQATYASIVGSNLGAFLTPLGALAGIMFTNLLNKHDIKYSFKEFVKYGVIISLPCIAVTLTTLYLMGI